MNSNTQNNIYSQPNPSLPNNNTFESPQKSPILLFAAISVIFLIFGCIGLFLYQRGVVSNLLENKSKITPTIAVIQTLPTKVENNLTWRTFANTEFGYAFKYPDIFKLNSDSNNRIIAVKQESNWDDYLSLGFEVRIYNFMEGVNVDNFKYLTIENYINSNSWGETLSKSPINIDGVAGYKLFTKSYELTNLGSEKVEYYAYRVILKKEDLVYEIYFVAKEKDILIEKDKIFDQILSTFKFISITPTASKEDESLVTYCCSITYICPDKSVKSLYVKNHSAHRLKKPTNCKAIGTGIPDIQAYGDENCTSLLNPYFDYCRGN